LALWLLEEVENEKVTLLKSVKWHQAKGEKVEIGLVEPAILSYNPKPEARADRHFFADVDLTLFRYLVKSGQLVLKEKYWSGDKYQFVSEVF